MKENSEFFINADFTVDKLNKFTQATNRNVTKKELSDIYNTICTYNIISANDIIDLIHNAKKMKQVRGIIMMSDKIKSIQHKYNISPILLKQLALRIAKQKRFYHSVNFLPMFMTDEQLALCELTSSCIDDFCLDLTTETGRTHAYLKYKGIVTNVSYSMSTYNNIAFEDAYSAALVGFTHAINLYKQTYFEFSENDTNKKYSTFGSFAKYYCVHYIKYYLKKQNLCGFKITKTVMKEMKLGESYNIHNNIESLDATLSLCDDSSNTSLSDTIAEESKYCTISGESEDDTWNKVFSELKQLLCDYEFDILFYTFGFSKKGIKRMNVNEIANKYGRSCSWIQYQSSKIIQKIQNNDDLIEKLQMIQEFHGTK